jgi:hypothetical protein
VHNYGFIITSNQLAMIQWYRNTGGDISFRFGHYKPPEPARNSNRPGAA